jgi:SAM-dependent methyltransferase
MARITFRFGTGETGNAYLEDGWAAPLPTLVWCTGEASTLALPIGAAASLRLMVMASLQPPELTAQRFGVLVDGVNTGEGLLAKLWSVVEVRLPPSPVRVRRIALRHPDGRPGRDGDPRARSVALSWATADIADSDPVLTDDLLIPPPSLLMDGSGSGEHFRVLGEGFAHISLIQRAALRPEERVLEIGSGNGQKARVLARYLTTGTYDGLDIVPEPIQWCRDRYAHLRNFRFHVADIASSHYRPGGALRAESYRLPFADAAFDLVFLCSVFTHMLPPEVANYTREIFRVLSAGGRCVATYFLLTDDLAGWADPPAMTFPHEHGPARVLSADNPTMGVAYPEAWARALWRAAGMRVAEINFGRWCGAPDRLQALQDAMLVVKP